MLTLDLRWAQNMPVCSTGLLAALLSTCACCFEAVVTAKHMTPTASVIQKRQGMLHLGKPCCIWFMYPAAVTCLAVRTTSSQQAKVDTNAAW